MGTELKELRGKLNERREKLAAVFREAKQDDGTYDMDKVSSLEGDSAAKVEQIRAINSEIDDLQKEVEEQSQLAGIDARVEDLGQVQPHPGHASKASNGAGRKAQPKSIGELFVESQAFTGWKPGMRQGPVADIAEIDFMATLFETGAGWAPADFRGPRVVDFATRPIRVVDLIPQTTTTAAAISYMEETTFTNAAAEVSEGSAKPEAALALTERTDNVRKIAVWLPVTDEQMADVPRARGYVDNRLGFMVRQRLDSQILVGDGTAPNISGILDRSGLQTQALGADAKPDAIYKAMTEVRVDAFSEPNAAVFHPRDWQDFRLLRTADGIYIWGDPAQAGPERIWGLPVVQTTAITEGTALVGDFQQTELAVRQGVTLAVSDSHDTYFISNKLAIRAEMRAALAVYRPAAFCQVTGL